MNAQEIVVHFFFHPFLPQLFLYHGLFVSDRWSMMYLRPTPPSSSFKKKSNNEKKGLVVEMRLISLHRVVGIAVLTQWLVLVIPIVCI